ncbi:helix-turn-helix domain-containing protein [Acidithiobacillus thiooxidans]|uniref:Helix-turn-helix domain-containing protein n=2 Tax=Acidithiobacillus thiooxidans TaxID=930 RepID=A0A1C2J3Y6_ACITH|nr:helix-turn-helix domain-containing protein [Acidithiobacillus thiooxidans]MBU2834800.1 helix-turn-helix domain-containing protein [Acidithiobacillus thiooxidans]OCX70603.1 hypothetical protein A6M23_13790 [Acidithiobacillus thiooxidans]OCX82955.1 hypothetical protein A6P08_11300 [Acidithiobacillus thiooxidans]QFX96685.1 DNA-binding protein [Acidithiobacillus thiooxidans ATCC 19377]
MDDLLTIEDLARVLRLNPRTVQNRRPEDLPPAIILPGTKRSRRWREKDVARWLAELPATVVAPESALDSFPRRGRPRKVV